MLPFTVSLFDIHIFLFGFKKMKFLFTLIFYTHVKLQRDADSHRSLKEISNIDTEINFESFTAPFPLRRPG